MLRVKEFQRGGRVIENQRRFVLHAKLREGKRRGEIRHASNGGVDVGKNR